MRGAIPVVNVIKLPITAIGNYGLHGDVDGGAFPVIPQRWGLQVTGVAADGKTMVAPTAWDVILQGSLDGLAFTDGSKMLENVNSTNANGDVVWQGSLFLPSRFAQIHVKTLTLGPAASILVSVLGIA